MTQNRNSGKNSEMNPKDKINENENNVCQRNGRKTKKKMKTLTTFLAIIFCIATLKGQDNMIINLVNNSNVTIAIDNIQRITFNGDNMLLKAVSGNENSYLLDDIACITFLDYTNPNAIEKFTENIDVNIYMNEYGEIKVGSQFEIRMLTVFDVNGKVITKTNRSHVNVSFISMGTYLLRVETTQGTVTKKFIKNR